jgi:hypothetical protein
LKGRTRTESILLAECIGEEAAGVGTPGKLWIAQSLERLGLCVEPLDRSDEMLPPLGRVEVPGELEDRWILERRIAMQDAARGKDEERAAERRIQLRFADRDLLPRNVGENNEIYVVNRRGTRLRSSRA